jgi:hypothetical protein
VPCPAGKSTLINALLGDTLLPSNNVPETARITAVHHCADASAPPLLSYPSPDGEAVKVQGAAAIREHLKQLNAAARNEQASMVAGEQLLQIGCQVAALAGAPAGAGRVVILDTPGPNEAGVCVCAGQGGCSSSRSLDCRVVVLVPVGHMLAPKYCAALDLTDHKSAHFPSSVCRSGQPALQGGAPAGVCGRRGVPAGLHKAEEQVRNSK